MYTIDRAFFDQRSGKNRRRKIKIDWLFYKGSEERRLKERRSQTERREGWVKVGKWSSVCLSDIMLARFLR
jgi:hypothetical protein